MRTEKKKILNTILMIVGSIVGFVIGYLIVSFLFSSPANFDKQLINAAEEINKMCPIMVDSGTRLDNAINIPGNQLAYNYTLVNLSKADIDVAQLQEQLRPLLINSVKTHDDLKIFRKNKVTLSYNYKDKEGNFLFKIVVGPEDYTE